MLNVQTPGAPQPKEKVKVLRPFIHNGERVTVDSVISVDQMLALELRNSGKAEATDEKLRQAPDKPNPAPVEAKAAEAPTA